MRLLTRYNGSYYKMLITDTIYHKKSDFKRYRPINQTHEIIMKTDIFALLDEKHTLMADGATGTNLFGQGLEAGYPPELWNVEKPDIIRQLHQSFVDAGSDIILTNSFGGTSYRLKLHKSQDRVQELNLAAAKLAREVADGCDRQVVVAGSMGPTGELIIPVGSLSKEDATIAFKEQALALIEGGVDVLWFETLSALEELEAGLLATQDLGVPVAATLSFDTNGNTMMGVTPERLVEFAKAHPQLKIIGMNCGTGASDVVAGITEAVKTASPEMIFVAKANCGIPEFVAGAIRYNGTPELMANYMEMVRNTGARIIGGCCGTSPEHLRAMRKALDERALVSHHPEISEIEEKLGKLTRALPSGTGHGHSPERPRRRRRDTSSD